MSPQLFIQLHEKKNPYWEDTWAGILEGILKKHNGLKQLENVTRVHHSTFITRCVWGAWLVWTPWDWLLDRVSPNHF